MNRITKSEFINRVSQLTDTIDKRTLNTMRRIATLPEDNSDIPVYYTRVKAIKTLLKKIDVDVVVSSYWPSSRCNGIRPKSLSDYRYDREEKESYRRTV